MKDNTTEPTAKESQEEVPDQSENLENQSEIPANELHAEPNQLAEMQKQLDESRNKYLYLFSDFENYKRNAGRERLELMTTAGRDMMTALLPVLDDFDRAAKNGELSEGTTLIHQKLISMVKNKGLVSLDIQPGDDFNPDTQEAVAEIPVTAEESKGKIVDILEQAYTLGGKIIRHAKVVVGK